VKKGMIFLVLTIVALGLVSVGCSSQPPTVSQAAFQQFQKDQAKADAAQDSRLNKVEEDVGETKTTRATEKAVKVVQDQLDAEIAGRKADALNTQLEVLRTKDAEQDKVLAEVKTSQQLPPRPPRYDAQSGTASISGQGSIFISRAGDYEFIISPDREIFVDGRSVTNHEVINLIYGSHTCQSSYPVQISWIWQSSY